MQAWHFGMTSHGKELVNFVVPAISSSSSWAFCIASTSRFLVAPWFNLKIPYCSDKRIVHIVRHSIV